MHTNSHFFEGCMCNSHVYSNTKETNALMAVALISLSQIPGWEKSRRRVNYLLLCPGAAHQQRAGLSMV